MRAFSAFVLLVLCACTLASWFHREPVRRSISPIRSTTSVDEFFPETAVATIRECLGASFHTMSSLAEHLRTQGEAAGETLEWRLVSFADHAGKKFRITYRSERPGSLPGMRYISLNDDGTQTALPPAESFQEALLGKTLLSDVASRSYQLKDGKSLTLQTEQGRVRAIEYRAGTQSLQCSSSFGPAVCACGHGSR